MSTKQDFFFGEYSASKGNASIALYYLEQRFTKVEPAFFTRQLNRFLAENGGHLTVSDGTSRPSFWGLIDSIEPSDVGFVEIYARNDVNNAVTATLACDIVLDNGIVSVVPHWCAYKAIRADEIVSTLLVPLYLKGLHARTYLRWDPKETTKVLVGDRWCHEETLMQVFQLAKYPLATFTPTDDRDKRLQRYIRELQCATEVAKESLRGEAAWECLRQHRDEARKADEKPAS